MKVERFGCNKHLQDFKFMKYIVKIAMVDKIKGEKKVCMKRKIHNSIFSVLIIENITLLSRELMFEIY